MFDSTEYPYPRISRLCESLLMFNNVCEPSGSCLNERIVNILVGSKKIRLGPAPSREQMATLCDMVGFYASRELPIEMLTLWGALKGYGLVEDRLEADLLDVCALRRYACLNSQVSSIYPPGLHFTIFSEDTTEVLLSPEIDQLRPKMDAYSMSLHAMIDSMSLGSVVEIISETERMNLLGVSVNEYMDCSRNAASVIFDYWKALRAVGYNNGESLPEFAVLQQMGWKGSIPKIMWDHYLARAASEKPYSSEDERGWYISLYFGNSFSRYRYGTVAAPLVEGKKAPAIKASFAAYPAGVPESLKFGRIEYKMRDNKNSTTSTPPWAGYGFIEPQEPEYRVACVSVREFRTMNSSYIQYNFNLNNTNVRADLLSV